MVWCYGQSCSSQAPFGSAVSFDLVSIRVISGGSKIASFPHLVKFRFSDSLTEILLWYQ